MRRIKTDEIAISSSLKEQDPTTLDAFKLMTTYLQIYDELHNTYHLKNVRKLYLNYKQESVIKISNILNTESRSLTRYRKKYLRCFCFCIKIVKKFGGLCEYLNKLL